MGALAEENSEVAGHGWAGYSLMSVACPGSRVAGLGVGRRVGDRMNRKGCRDREVCLPHRYRQRSELSGLGESKRRRGYSELVGTRFTAFGSVS